MIVNFLNKLNKFSDKALPLVFYTLPLCVLAAIIAYIISYVDNNKHKKPEKIIGSKYIYYINNSSEFENVYVYEDRSSAKYFAKRYEKEKISKQYSVNAMSQKCIVRGLQKIPILKYSSDSLLAKVKYLDMECELIGWVPSYTLHDTIFLNIVSETQKSKMDTFFYSNKK